MAEIDENERAVGMLMNPMRDKNEGEYIPGVGRTHLLLDVVI